MITPTYARSSQKADLTRLCQTLMHVDNLCWVVIEDSEELTPLVTRLLQRCKVWSVQLYVKTPPPPETKKRRRRRRKKRVIPRNRGGEQRNVGLQWLRDSYEVGEVNGVVYFGDDDNTYDLRVFEEVPLLPPSLPSSLSSSFSFLSSLTLLLPSLPLSFN